MFSLAEEYVVTKHCAEAGMLFTFRLYAVWVPWTLCCDVSVAFFATLCPYLCLKVTSDGSAFKKRRAITMEVKCSEKNETPMNIGCSQGLSCSTVATTIKDKGCVLEHVKGSHLCRKSGFNTSLGTNLHRNPRTRKGKVHVR